MSACTDISTLCTLAAHAVHVIVAPQSLTVNIQRRNFFIVLDTVQLLFSLVQIFLKFSLHREALSLLLTSFSILDQLCC